MAKYSASGSQTLTTGAETALTVGSNATAAQRNRIYELLIANVGVPADVVILHTVQRCTALGTAGAAVTPTKLDQADRAAQAAVGENHSVEPTYTANEEVLEVGLNARATFRWVAAPGSEIVTPATVASGVGAKALHASAVTDWRVGALWEE